MRRLSFAARYLEAAAAELGWTVEWHPDGRFAGRVRLGDGSHRYFVRSTYDINPSGAWLVARDKALTKFYLQKGGFPVIPGRTFFSERLCRDIGTRRDRAAALRYACRVGFPVMVKANFGSGGNSVEQTMTLRQLEASLRRLFAVSDVVLIERYVAGLRDFRILVLDGRVVLAYERTPCAVVGDGERTVRELLMDTFPTAPSDLVNRVGRYLRSRSLKWSFVPRRGRRIVLLDVANLTQGGIATEITNEIDPALAALAVGAARQIGLRYCGVDVLTDDGTVPSAQRLIVELNGSPTIHQFANQSRMSERRLIDLHTEFLLAMARTLS